MWTKFWVVTLPLPLHRVFSQYQRIMSDTFSLQFELRPTTDIIPNAVAYLQSSVLTYQIEDLEYRFDDLRNALTFAKTYNRSVETPHDDIQRFISEMNELLPVFYSAISSLDKSEGKERLDFCLQAYKKALDGYDVEGKFVREWNKILSTKVSVSFTFDFTCCN